MAEVEEDTKVKPPKKTKNQLRRERAKLKKQQEQQQRQENGRLEDKPEVKVEDAEHEALDQVIIEPNGDSQITFDTEVDRLLDNPLYAQFKSVFNRFYTEESKEDEDDRGQIFYSDDEDDKALSDESDEESKIVSQKSLKKQKRIPLPQLKKLAPKPELVEWFDADSPEPLMLVQIKSCHGVVPVPDHWQLKREYLSARRGIKKAAFELPQFIKDTGIMDMRDALKEDERTLRQKTRERVQPKMGKLDIDYQKLYNAFFRFQTRPRLYGIGDIYYEGKEEELESFQHFRPGRLSSRLKDALNIPPGAPPPWLLNMQRYGPPPSYHGLRIPGLNAPIPPGAEWGYQPGGYGKPPVDEKGTPIYGDVYGLSQQAKRKQVLGIPVEKELWGALQDYEDEEEEEEEEEEEDDEQGQGYVDEETALAAERRQQQQAAPEPDLGPIELRKQKRSAEDHEEPQGPEVYEEFEDDRKLYEVLEEKKDGAKGFLGTQRSYQIPSSPERKKRRFEEKFSGSGGYSNNADFQKELDQLVQEESKKARR